MTMNIDISLMILHRLAPSSYYDISSPVSLPVYVKPYLKKNGDASYTLCVQKDYLPITKGEAF